MHKLFAFEHTFDDATARECEGLDDLVMFPAHHELQGTGESTVSLHLQVVMDTLAVNILMSLESAIRSATSSAAGGLPAARDLASVLLDVNVEPQQTQAVQAASSPVVLSRDADSAFGSASSPTTSRSSLTSGPSFASIPSPLVAGVAALDPRNRRRKRQLARREKLLGDYSVLVSCISDAMDHYSVAIEMLREEERRSGGAPGDALWLAAALEGYVFCLYSEAHDKFLTELVEKASEAVALYAKAGTVELESMLIENLGWYYAGVATATLTRSSVSGEAKLLESIWAKRLLWDVLERGLMLFPELQTQRQVEFLIQTSRMLETVGHRRRVAFFLHEAASLLLARNAPSTDAKLRLLLSPSSTTKGPQRQRDLKAALLLERVAAEHLGIQGQNARINALPWEVTTQYRRNRRKKTSEHDGSTNVQDDSWLIIRFHVLRQLLTIARMLGDAFFVGTYCLQLLEMLAWCDSIALQTTDSSSPAVRKSTSASMLLVDHLQQPATSIRAVHAPAERAATGLHTKSGAYFSPPPGIDTRVKRNFINSPSATMSNAAASLSSTLTNTPRILATPRQQFSAAVNAISTKAAPAFTPFSHSHHPNGATPGRTGGEDRGAARITSAVDGRDFGGMNGDGNDLKSARMLDTGDGDVDKKLRIGTPAEAPTVWNLRSKADIARIERKLLNLLESDCTTLRASEQVHLPTFLRVERLKLRSSCNLEHPFISRDTALGMFSVYSTSNQQIAKSDFFYSPFEKQKTARITGRNGSDEDNVSDDAPDIYERGFPVHENIELQLILSNPTGVAIKLQQVKAWVVFAGDNGEARESDDSTILGRGDGVECYPSFFTLAPYEKRKTVILAFQPLKVGVFHVCGCFLKAFNIMTSFKLNDPVSIRVVGELPMVSLSLREHVTMNLSEGDKASATNVSAASKMRIAMFASETKRCMVRVRSTGNQQITNYRLAVTVQHRRAAKQTCVIFNNLPPASAAAGESSLKTINASPHSVNSEAAIGPKQVDIEAVALRCGKVVSSPLPLSSGNFVSIPFEVMFRGNNELGGALEDNIEVEWSFVYADEACSTDIFYRESKLALEVVSLSSLMLRSISVLPYSVEQIPIDETENTLYDKGPPVATTDHLYCAIVIHVVNPTETAFCFRLHRDMDSSGDAACEAEMGRQCSRQFVVEVPRLPSLTSEQGPAKLTGVLNDLLEMEWETYFGTCGRLLCEERHLGSVANQEQIRRELLLPPISLQVHSPIEGSMRMEAHESQNGNSHQFQRKDGRSLHPLSFFFRAPHFRFDSRPLQAELFQYIPITITAQRPPNADDPEEQPLGVEAEIVITEEGEEAVREISEHVVIVGLLKTQILWDELMGKTARSHEIQCMFLAEGNYRITVCGRVLTPGMKVSGEIWSHQSMHIRVQSEDPVPAVETAGRPLLIEKLKLLAIDLHEHSRHAAIRSTKDAEILDYVLSTEDTSSTNSYNKPMTPRMEDLSPRSLSHDPVDGVTLRPGTASARRPLTSGSQRPVSRGSTISISSITAVLDCPEVRVMRKRDSRLISKLDFCRFGCSNVSTICHRCLTYLKQGCLEMEKDLIDDDRRKVAAAKTPPSISDLHELRKTLEKTLEDQVLTTNTWIVNEASELTLFSPACTDRRQSRRWRVSLAKPTDHLFATECTTG
ncbi:unnamed protein product [Phytophthora lilii]|uniref:Unnamed protein product n=1 Tax=Phytophthora lilii TaxID=2077276 RepID=A0A9W6TEV7_9STRA|nr:unnamed protein product [Phytophthora lilii]